MSRKQLAMAIDASSCIDCKACMAACKVANKVPEGEWRNWIKGSDIEALARAKGRQTFQPGNCMHCDNPTCVQACPTGATYKNKLDGTVVIDHGLCIGCGQCIPACPYGARFRNRNIKMADKCDFCAPRRSAGLEPACVSTCPTKARTFGDLNDPSSEINRLLSKTASTRIVNVKTNTAPNIYYLGSTGPDNWPAEAQNADLLCFLKSLAGPVVNSLVFLSGLGVAAMFLNNSSCPMIPPG